jgi:imidazolonepropionase-like amidohydrolase
MRLPNPLRVWSTVNPFRNPVFVSLALVLVPAAWLTAQDGRTRRGGRNRTVLALEVGTIHTVSGPTIEKGVILIRGGRILGVGPADKVRIPTSAVVERYPDAHAYPGLVDALSSAFTSAKELSNSSTNAGTDFFDALDASDEASRKLVRAGITTAYVSNRSSATWRGLGAIVRPNANGFSTLRGKRHGGVSLRMTTGNRAGHALDRLKKFDTTGNVFDSLEVYEKKQKDYEKALADYKKSYQNYLDHFRKKSKKTGKSRPGDKPDPAKKSGAAGGKSEKGGTNAKPSGKQPAGKNSTGETGTRRTEGRRGRRGGPGGRRRTPGAGGRPKGGPAGTTTAAPRGGAKGAPAKDKKSSGGAAPKKPKWPKRVKKDPAKEALLKILSGKLPLRVEVHRKDEIRAALFMAMNKELPGITLEFATDAGAIAKELAESGAPVVVTDLLPMKTDLEQKRDRGALPASLHEAGVAVAIGSGSVDNARNLTLMAAYACGRGLPEDAAVRALTLTPAEILGVADQIGSLARNKVADILITTGPLLRSDTRVVRVIAQGRTQYEAK